MSQVLDSKEDAKRATRKAVVAHGIRWSNNVLCELLHNYGSSMEVAERDALIAATKALAALL